MQVLNKKPKVVTGQVFGRWTVVEPDSARAGNAYWKCTCECGTASSVKACHLISGGTKSCGCLQAELARDASTTHNLSRLPEYKIWTGMRVRCYNPRATKYGIYGARGITVCERWESFAAFYEDMGPRPPGSSIDRIDNDGNYEPGNCRWSTCVGQSNNRRSNRMITFHGETLTVAQLGRRLSIQSRVIYKRLYRGWSVERALTEQEWTYHKGTAK